MNTTGLITILIDKQEIKLRFGLPACQVFYMMCLDDDSEKYINGTALTGLGIAKLMYAAHENACIVDDKETIITLGGMLDYVETMILDDPAYLEKIVEVFVNSKHTQKLAEREAEVQKVLEEEKKRSLTGTSLNHSATTNSSSRKKNISVAPTGSLSFGNKGTNAQKLRKQRPKK